mgnify:CR=1 FL=1
MLQEVMTKPGEIIFREIPVPEITEDHLRLGYSRISWQASLYKIPRNTGT